MLREVVILIPDFEPDQNVEIDVRINGRKKTIKYRVELLSWQGSDAESDEKVDILRHKVNNYDKDWELVEIGAPEGDQVPLMFRRINKDAAEKKDTK